MDVKEFYESLNEKPNFTKLTSTGISDNLPEVFKFVESYIQYKGMFNIYVDVYLNDDETYVSIFENGKAIFNNIEEFDKAILTVKEKIIDLKK